MESESPNEPGRKKDVFEDLQSRIEKALEDLKPRVKRAFEELDATIDSALADVKPKVDAKMKAAQPKVDHFMNEVQPKIDDILRRMANKLEEVRKDLEERAHRGDAAEGAPTAGPTTASYSPPDHTPASDTIQVDDDSTGGSTPPARDPDDPLRGM
jgi:hypothetical protein